MLVDQLFERILRLHGFILQCNVTHFHLSLLFAATQAISHVVHAVDDNIACNTNTEGKYSAQQTTYESALVVGLLEPVELCKSGSDPVW